MSRAYLNLIKTLFKDGAPDGIDEATTLENVKKFMSGVFEGYRMDFGDDPRSSLPAVKWGSPNHEKLLHLEKNVYQFSGAKNWQMMRDLTDAIKDGDRVLPYKEFRTKALAIIGEYQGNWLNTEYNAAIAGAQMASKWVDYSAHPEALIEYRTMEDTRVRPEHAELNGIMRPVNDKFWDTYYPPNGWNCRCTVIRLNDGERTPDKKLAYPEIPKIFRTNLAKTGQVLPMGIIKIGVPKDVFRQATDLIPQHPKPKGSLKIHPDYTPKEDHEILKTISEEKARAGHHVEVLPELPKHETEKREKILPGAKENKNPDLRIDGKYVEVKGLTTGKTRAIKDRLDKGASQADHVILNIPEKFDEQQLPGIIKKKFIKHPDLKIVEVRHEGKYTLYKREDYIK